MNEEQFEIFCHLLNRLTIAVETLAENQSGKKGANYIKPLSEYPRFDWSAIGAEIISSDSDGVTSVAWKGRQYTRRCKPKFGNEIWFSCCTGKDENGENTYERLISFKDTKAIEVEPIPTSIKQLIPVPKAEANNSQEFSYWQQQVRELVRGLNWSADRVKAWSQQNFSGKKSTTEMTVEELKIAFGILQSLRACENQRTPAHSP